MPPGPFIRLVFTISYSLQCFHIRYWNRTSSSPGHQDCTTPTLSDRETEGRYDVETFIVNRIVSSKEISSLIQRLSGTHILRGEHQMMATLRSYQHTPTQKSALSERDRRFVDSGSECPWTAHRILHHRMFNHPQNSKLRWEGGRGGGWMVITNGLPGAFTRQGFGIVSSRADRKWDDAS